MTEWKGKTRGGSWGYLFFIFLIKKCGITAAYSFLAVVIPYFIPFAPKATQNIWFYARKILHLSIIQAIGMLLKNYYSLGQVLIDKIAMQIGLADKYSFRFENRTQFLETLDSNLGAIIIGAHIGNWEAGVPYFLEYGKKINIVLHDVEYQKIKKILEENTIEGYQKHKFIPISSDGLSHVLAIKQALDNGEYVCFQGDRYLNEERTLSHEFLGKTASFPAGPFLLASRLNLPVVFYFAMREKKKTYRFHFTIANNDIHKKNPKREEKLLEQYTSTLENIVKSHPEQWFNYYKFWDDSK